MKNLRYSRKQDPSNMMGHILNFPFMVEDAIRIGRSARLPDGLRNLKKILITGLGGSAIGGDILKNILSDKCAVPVTVNRNYYMPKWVDAQTLVIAVSHSGNTEETLSAFKDALKKKAKLLAVTTGGTLEKLAKQNKLPVILVPAGAPPRASLPYLFFPVLLALQKLGYAKSEEAGLAEVPVLLEKLKKLYGPGVKTRNNPAKLLAGKIFSKPVIVIGCADTTDATATRWKCQLAENSKVLAFSSVLPEMNHNEIVGWELLKKVLKHFAVVFLQDRGTSGPQKKRIALTRAIIKKRAGWTGEINSTGKSPLARIFSLIYLGDFASVYLALLYKKDPTAIKLIEDFKKALKRK